MCSLAIWCNKHLYIFQRLQIALALLACAKQVITCVLLQFGVISTCKFFKDYKLHLPYWLVQFVVFEKLTCAYKHQIALEVMLLPILIEVGHLLAKWFVRWIQGQ